MKEYINSDFLANQLRMIRTVNRRAVLIVEGDTDRRFFERFIDPESCYVKSAIDRKRAVELIQKLNADSIRGVLAVVDADFGRITGSLETDLNLVYCDGHDLEIMLIKSNAFASVVNEHCSDEKLAKLLKLRNPSMKLADLLATSCLPLGVMLLVSLRNQLDLTFDELSFGDFVDKKTLEFSKEKLIKSVMDKSIRHDSELAKQILLEITTEISKQPNIWEMSRGHDCMELLSFALNGTIGTKKSETDDRKSTKVTRESLEREFRLAFSEVDFSRTELFPAICDWEAANKDAYKILGDNTRAVQIAVSIANRSMITPPHPSK